MSDNRNIMPTLPRFFYEIDSEPALADTLGWITSSCAEAARGLTQAAYADTRAEVVTTADYVHRALLAYRRKPDSREHLKQLRLTIRALIAAVGDILAIAKEQGAVVGYRPRPSSVKHVHKKIEERQQRAATLILNRDRLKELLRELAD